MMNLDHKVALVTGASSGIGRATARLFAKAGAKVVVGARRAVLLDRLVTEISHQGGIAIALAGDVAQEDYNQALVDLAMSEFGGLDVAFDNAGMLKKAAVTDIDLDDWELLLRTNLTSGFLAAKYQIPVMKDRGGSIIFTASFVGYTLGMPEMSAYAASKAGLVGLTKALAAEYGSHGIRVNALVPGGTLTPKADEFGTDPKIGAFVNVIHALKRQASAEEIAHSALYLASDASSFTTGSAMLVDGGVSICKM